MINKRSWWWFLWSWNGPVPNTAQQCESKEILIFQIRFFQDGGVFIYVFIIFVGLGWFFFSLWWQWDFFFLLNLHPVIHYCFLPQLCWQRGGGRVDISASGEVVGLVYRWFKLPGQWQHGGSVNCHQEQPVSGLGWHLWAKHSPGRLSLHQQHSDTAMAQP